MFMVVLNVPFRILFKLFGMFFANGFIFLFSPLLFPSHEIPLPIENVAINESELKLVNVHDVATLC